jgi:hypothetical protein
MTEKRRDANLARRALTRATEGAEPEMTRLLDAVPEMMAEAARRRRLESRLDPVSAVVPLAWKLIPRLAAAAVLLVVVSATVYVMDSDHGEEAGRDFDSLIYNGSAPAGGQDLLLEAIVDQENGNG